MSEFRVAYFMMLVGFMTLAVNLFMSGLNKIAPYLSGYVEIGMACILFYGIGIGLNKLAKDKSVKKKK